MKTETRRWIHLYLVVVVSLVSEAYSQDLVLPLPVELPGYATALEGIPIMVVKSDPDQTTRTVLNKDQAADFRLLVTIVDGQFFCASRNNSPLVFRQSGSYTYLYNEAFIYIKFARYGDKIIYMEHVNSMLYTITYWGELKVITGGNE